MPESTVNVAYDCSGSILGERDTDADETSDDRKPEVIEIVQLCPVADSADGANRAGKAVWITLDSGAGKSCTGKDLVGNQLLSLLMKLL